MSQEARIRRAAAALLKEGNDHGWWKAVAPSTVGQTLETMDEIGREEFLDLTARILQAADAQGVQESE